jgi:hypothetical protein
MNYTKVFSVFKTHLLYHSGGGSVCVCVCVRARVCVCVYNICIFCPGRGVNPGSSCLFSNTLPLSHRCFSLSLSVSLSVIYNYAVMLCPLPSVTLPSVIIISVVMPSVFMPSVAFPSVIIYVTIFSVECFK